MSPRNGKACQGSFPAPTSRRRVGRITLAALAAGAIAAITALLYLGQSPPTALADPPVCNPPLPQPGPGRPWEASVSVSTYSSVNTHNGNVFTAIPIVSWSGVGPDMNMMVYHNSAGNSTFAQAVGFNLGPGWSIAYSDHLLLDQLPTTVTAVAANGMRTVFTWHSGQQQWVPPAGVHDELTQIDSVTWRLTHKDQSYHQFWSVGCSDAILRLDRIVDPRGTPPWCPTRCVTCFIPHRGF